MKSIFESVFSCLCMCVVCFRIAKAVRSKISMRPQFTQISSAEPSCKENLPPQAWHDCIFLFVKSIGHIYL